VEQANALLDHLEVPSATALRYLSGGQLQRVALARTLALQPDLILYDEPTTGLDPTNAKRVAELIRDHGETRTSLIVTHDPRTLASIVDRAYLLNSETLQIEEVEVEKATSRLLDLGGGPLSASPQTQQRSSIPSQFLEKTGKVLIALTLALGHLLPTFPRWRYGWRSLRHSLSLTASVGSFAYVAMAGVIIGFVSTYFTFEHLPRRGFTEPLFVDDILRALGYLLYRVLAPVLLTLLVAARAGAAINSHIGNKVYARQLDGLRSLGVTPSRYLLTSSLWALLLAMPLLLAVMYLTARTLSLGVFIFTHPDQTYFFWDQNFHRSLRTAGETLWVGSWWLLLKVELCAFGIAAIAYFQGAREKLAAQDVSQSVTRTIIAASLYVLVVHFALAFLEF
jgi:ABC-type transporter Mla maintaining outer membrane lipid asymmetry permease subunit MlaE